MLMGKRVCGLVAAMGTALLLLPGAIVTAEPGDEVTKSLRTIFDMGLDPTLSDTSEEKREPAEQDVKREPGAENATDPPKDKTPADRNTGKGGDDAKRKNALADLARVCQVSPDGVITVKQRVDFVIRGTEEKNFRLTGELYFAKEPTPWKGGGVYFFFRQLDGMHRYQVGNGGISVKRILLEGKTVKQFARPVVFTDPAREKWHLFAIDINPDRIAAQIGHQRGIARGPLNTKGTNVIVLQPGGKLRNLKLVIHDTPEE